MNTSVTLQDLTRVAPRRRRHSRLVSGLVALSAALLLSATGAASAAGHGGGFGGGGHGGFGGFGGGHAGFAGGGFARGGFARGGFARGGFGHGGYGRPYGYGRGYGYGWGGWGLGWGLGLGLGLYLSALPWDYSTYWWDGVPYYYTGDNYYTWDGAAGEYEQVQPPAQVTQQAANAPPPHLYAYPKNGQSPQQQASDEAACRDWASHQTGGGDVAPAAPGSTPQSSSSAVGAIAAATGAPSSAQLAATPGPNSEFLRAEAACLQGRGYSVD